MSPSNEDDDGNVVAGAISPALELANDASAGAVTTERAYKVFVDAFMMACSALLRPRDGRDFRGDMANAVEAVLFAFKESAGK